MIDEKIFPFLAEKGHVISLVGGGGKTTLLYAFARHCAAKGWRVLVSTTTHIRQPGAHYAADEAALAALWAEDRRGGALLWPGLRPGSCSGPGGKRGTAPVRPLAF